VLPAHAPSRRSTFTRGVELYAGSLPDTLSLLTNLVLLQLGSNRLCGTNFVGLTERQLLIVSARTGRIPEELSALAKLTHLQLDCNTFTGIACLQFT
jgi:hypothetical protein